MQVQVVDVNTMFIVLPREKGKKVLAKELATLILTSGQREGYYNAKTHCGHVSQHGGIGIK
jgi:hypothetical protein